MKLSVIVPVFKVEAYLEFCLRSIARQEVDDCEFILVDDFSPDNCGAICDKWAQEDKRFRVIHRKENGGLSAARNTGMDAASGEYITFVDSDDYISPDTLKANMELLAQHPEVEVLEYPVCVNHGTAHSYHYIPGNCKINDYTEWTRRKGYLHCYAWNKIFKRTLWSSFRFPEGKWFEDVYTIPYVLKQAHHILCTDKGLYYYCSRSGSISNTLCDKGINDLLQANLALYQTLSNQAGLSVEDLDDMYLRLCDPQIVKLQMGGALCVPDRKIPLRRALFTRRPLNYRIKAIVKALSGEKYCSLVARTRKVLKR